MPKKSNSGDEVVALTPTIFIEEDLCTQGLGLRCRDVTRVGGRNVNQASLRPYLH